MTLKKRLKLHALSNAIFYSLNGMLQRLIIHIDHNFGLHYSYNLGSNQGINEYSSNIVEMNLSLRKL